MWRKPFQHLGYDNQTKLNEFKHTMPSYRSNNVHYNQMCMKNSSSNKWMMKVFRGSEMRKMMMMMMVNKEVGPVGWHWRTAVFCIIYEQQHILRLNICWFVKSTNSRSCSRLHVSEHSAQNTSAHLIDENTPRVTRTAWPKREAVTDRHGTNGNQGQFPGKDPVDFSPLYFMSFSQQIQEMGRGEVKKLSW